MQDRDIKNRIVRKMLRKGVVGGHKKSKQTITNWLASHQQGAGKRCLDELVQAGVLERYGGGHRENYRLTSVERAVEFLKDNGGDVPFGFD